MQFMQGILRTAPPASALQAVQWPHIATNMEWLHDELGSARDGWTLFSMVSLADGKTAAGMVGLAEAARLEASLGRSVQALGWLSMLDQLSDKPANGAVDCVAGKTRAHALALVAAGSR